jgi:hypothetical protein
MRKIEDFAGDHPRPVARLLMWVLASQPRTFTKLCAAGQVIPLGRLRNPEIECELAPECLWPQSGSSAMSRGSILGCADLWWRSALEVSYAFFRSRMIEPSGRCAARQCQAVNDKTSSP